MDYFYFFVALLLSIGHASSDDYRLPTNISPYHYDIHISIEETSFSNSSDDFSGSVTIYFNVINGTSEIKLHSSNRYISLQNITVGTEEIPQENFSLNETTEILTITLNEFLPAGTSSSIKIDYTAQLVVVEVSGFFKTSYENEDGITKYVTGTRLQADHARKAFPCWDEPDFKATFQLTITHPSELNALSNTAIRSQEVINDQTTTQFDETPIMSVYLVAFVVSDFTCTEAESVDVASHRVCSAEKYSSIRDWSVNLGPKVIAAFNEYTDFNYSRSMTKLDQIAIPPNFGGAMENWGLVTYSEIGLLWDPEESTNSYKQYVATIIAHELGHMWFGNLVTCKWWSVTFLNEGFAQFYQYHMLHEVLPNWELKKQFVILVLQTAFEYDSDLTSLPLESDASTHADISAKFGTLTYRKGASIFHMVENIMGYENFKEGIRDYLERYQYQTVEPVDLWESLNARVNNVSDLPNEDLHTVMETWVKSAGYPLLTVTSSGRNILVTQERFLLSDTDTTTKWYVPVSFTTSLDSNKFESTSPMGWLTPTAGLTITLEENAEWIILNNQQSAYYRVNYDQTLWQHISTALLDENFSGIPELNRAQIVNDAFALIKADKLHYSEVLNIIGFLKNDVSYFSWYPAFTEFTSILRHVGQGSRLGQAIVAHISDLIETLYQSVLISVIDVEDQIYTLKQVSALTWACRLGKEDCLNSVSDVFTQFKENSVRPSGNLRSLVYCNGIRNSNDSSDWNFLWSYYLTTELTTEQTTIITGLGCSKDETILKSYLLKAITEDSGIKPDHSTSVFSAVSQGSPLGLEVAFDFFIEYFDAIENYFQNVDTLGNILKGIAERFTTSKEILQLENFIQTGNLTTSFIEKATESLQTAQENLAWLEKYSIDLQDYYGIESDEEKEEEIIDEVDPEESDKPEYRLPKVCQPYHYEIHITAPPEAFTADGNVFYGTVVIYFTVTRATKQVKLHVSSEYTVVDTIELNNEVIPSENYSLNSTTDILTISYPSGLVNSTQYALTIEYAGSFATNNRGLYKTSYVDDEEVTRYLLATHLQPTNARRLYPCFDEPSFKATFQVLLTYPSEYHARSNTPESFIRVDEINNMTTVQFERTPVMSSYLVVFVISDFTCTESPYDSTNQICGRDNMKEHRQWALDIAQPLLESLNRYTGYNYNETMSKLDNFAIPNLASGAMENWGLVTYQEGYLHYSLETSTMTYKRYLVLLIAHEYIHSWFGNLVTCEWWSETFLNEGLARYFQYFIAHDVLPDWQFDKQFVTRVHHVSFENDATLSALPLQSPASTPAEATAKFGTLSYYKGASVIRMMEHVIGTENLRTGFQNYLVKHQFGNTKPEDMWDALFTTIDTSILPADYQTIMVNWVKLAGFPLLHVSIDENNNFIVSQQRFLESGEDTTTKWYVPVSYTTSLESDGFENTAPKAWLTPTDNVILESASNVSWIILNPQVTAYYRVNYDDAIWSGIGTALQGSSFSGIPEVNRAQIVNDLFTLIEVKKISYSRAFRVLDFLENDDSYIVWYPVNTGLNTLFTYIALHSNLGEALQAHLLRLSNKLYDSVPISVIDEENQVYTLNQILAMTLACRLGNEKCAEDVREHFSSYRNDGVVPPKNLKSLIYCNGIRHSKNDSDWEFLWQAFITATSDRTALRTALGCSTDEDILYDYLNRSITTGSGSTTSDTSSIFSAVYANHIGVDVAFRFLVENHEAIYNYLRSWTTVGNILRGIAAKFTSHGQLEELKRIVTTGVLNSSLVSAGNLAISTVETNLGWIEYHQNDLYGYYGLEVTTTSTTTSTNTTIPDPTSAPITTNSTISSIPTTLETTTPVTTEPTTSITTEPTTPGGSSRFSSSVTFTVFLIILSLVANKYAK